MARQLALLRLLSRPSRQGRAAVALPIAAFAVTTAMLLTVAGGAAMFLSVADPDYGALYGMLAAFAALLLAVPATTLAASAARLSSRRRDDRLATLRLLGASAGEIWTLTVVEATLIAAVGAAAGVILLLPLLPLVGLLPFFGAPVGAAQVAPSPLLALGVVAGVVLLAAVSAATSLRRVQVTPLGVRSRADAPRKKYGALIAGVVGLAVVAFVLSAGSAIGEVFGAAVMIVVTVGLFAVTMLLVNLIGTPVVAARGRAIARRAHTAAHLIAGRELAAHAAVAWRRVSGMAVVSFIAVVAGSGLAFADLLGVDVLTSDIRTGVLLTLAVAFVLLACAVGVTQAASVLEERDLLVGLDRLGVPERELRRARRMTVMVPLRWAAVGGAVAGAGLVLPLAGVALIVAPLSLLTIALTFVAGFALVGVALASTRPLVRGIRNGAG